MTTTSGGTVNLLSSNLGLSLNVPVSFAAFDANFQIHQLDKVAVLAATSEPTGYTIAGNNIYELKALTSNDTVVSTFNAPLLVTVSYATSDVSNLSESSLRIYRWDGNLWNQLTGCSVNTSQKTVTCETTHFSTFGLFGQIGSDNTFVVSNNNNNNNVSVQVNSVPSCGDNKPSSSPDLFQINVNSNSAKLFFTPITNTQSFYISYSTKPIAEGYSAQVTLAREGIQNFTINLLKPNTTYYLKVRGQNGCMPGDWSNVIKITTRAKGVNTIKIFYKSIVSNIVTTISNRIKSIFTKTKLVPTIVPVAVPTVEETVITSTPYPTYSYVRSTVAPIRVPTSIPTPVLTPKKICFLWWCF